ncbi:hypothetical protein NIES2119_04190 [[Phormidium ambiguum] IAM M-71]|uniref:Uncharacterized protein n=1 Tax=[Phormidium ambiguum] IAM M-71 TaxID=454136 RepID=A0A1U7IRY6_9CYAN|nr:hypothetical protein NIES2119_04190 [Phormidium ambiguum IAM M-71]
MGGREAGEQGSRGAGEQGGQGDKGNFYLLPSAFCLLPFFPSAFLPFCLSSLLPFPKNKVRSHYLGRSHFPTDT